jgi:isochorismate hydrolase
MFFQIEKMTTDLSIYMDNLCQFLSQERVQDFSKMNAKELLLNTQKTVGMLFEKNSLLNVLIFSLGVL